MPRPCHASATATLTSALADLLTGTQPAIPTVTPSGANTASASGANRSIPASADSAKRSSHSSNTNNRAYSVSAPSPAKQLVNQLAIPASSPSGQRPDHDARPVAQDQPLYVHS